MQPIKVQKSHENNRILESTKKTHFPHILRKIKSLEQWAHIHKYKPTNQTKKLNYVYIHPKASSNWRPEKLFDHASISEALGTL